MGSFVCCPAQIGTQGTLFLQLASDRLQIGEWLAQLVVAETRTKQRLQVALSELVRVAHRNTLTTKGWQGNPQIAVYVVQQQSRNRLVVNLDNLVEAALWANYITTRLDRTPVQTSHVNTVSNSWMQRSKQIKMSSNSTTWWLLNSLVKSTLNSLCR